jgi:hypothetical protein
MSVVYAECCIFLLLCQMSLWECYYVECRYAEFHYAECHGSAKKAGLLNKSLCLVPTLGVTEFIIVKHIILVTLCCAT